jgi:hypothetical protein
VPKAPPERKSGRGAAPNKKRRNVARLIARMLLAPDAVCKKFVQRRINFIALHKFCLRDAQ